ncbi:MAG TPA: DUF302 domain-containing protein [Gemmatimonadales bacterium]
MLAALLLTLALAPGLSATDTLVRVRSDAPAAATIARVAPTLAARKLTLFATVDHAENARAAGLTLPAATVFIFGNPAAGTRVMQCDIASAIDLPLRLLVWEADGAAWVGYRDPAGLAGHHDLARCGEILAAMSRALGAIAAQVAGTPKP